MIQVLIADGQLSFRSRLREMLERRRDIEVIGEAADATSAYQAVEQTKPDVLLIDLALCQHSSAPPPAAARACPGRTVVMVAAIDDRAILDAFRFGAHGILLKSAGPPLWRKTIRRVMEGQYCFENGTANVLLEAFHASLALQSRESRRDYGLTTREMEIVARIVSGYSNRQVGEHFSICERTVKHHLTNIFGKLGVSTRLELALFAVNNQLVAEDPGQAPQREGEKEVAVRHRSAAAAMLRNGSGRRAEVLGAAPLSE